MSEEPPESPSDTTDSADPFGAEAVDRVPLGPSFATVAAVVFYVIVMIAGYGSTSLFGVLLVAGHSSAEAVICGLFAVAATLAVLVVICGAIWRKTGKLAAVEASYAFLVLAVMPVWGVVINQTMLSASCTFDPCSDQSEQYRRVLASPGVFVLAGVQALVALAFLVSKRRPEKLHPLAEPWIHAFLLVGILLHVLLAVHFGKDMVTGAMLFPFGGAAISPPLTIVLLVVELRVRLRNRGQEAAQPRPVEVNDPFRGAVVRHAPVAKRVHVRTLVQAFLGLPVILGVYAIVAAIVWHEKYGAFAVFTRTCTHTFSRIALETLPMHPCGEHYLCTVAARGHASLARPERIGMRRGQAIIVNRQLAVANAFEDLLHERTPRFGAFARHVYDKLGLPVSRLIRNRYVADAVFLAMKPFEWTFYLTLLLFDKGAPENRIDRMYR